MHRMLDQRFGLAYSCADDRARRAASVTVLKTGSRARPAPESHLVALACGVADRRSAQAPAMRALSHRVNDAALLAVLEGHRLTALAGTRLDDIGALPEGIRPAVEAELQTNRRRALFCEHVGTQVLAALDADGIPALALKGFALADSIHADPGFRRYNDIDVLVSAEHLDGAVAALTPLGYRSVHEPRGYSGLPELHVRMQDPSGRLPLVELHWRVHWFEERFSAEMLQRSHMVSGRRRARLADELAALLLFFARDGFVGLRLAADIAAWWDVCSPSLEPLALDALADEQPPLRRVWSTALRVAERVVGVRAERVMSPLEGSRRDMVAVRLANWAAVGDRDQVSADVTLVDMLLTPTRRLPSSARRHLFLPRATLEEFYDLRGDERLRRLNWRLLHPPKMLLRYALALLRARDASVSGPRAKSAGASSGVG